jgi:HK97 family phage portal protein
MTALQPSRASRYISGARRSAVEKAADARDVHRALVRRSDLAAAHGRAHHMDSDAYLGMLFGFVAICAERVSTHAARVPLRLYRPAPTEENARRGFRAKAIRSRVVSRRLPAWESRSVKQRLSLGDYGRKAASMARQVDEMEEVTEHPALDLIDRPNSVMRGADWRTLQGIYKLICGDRFDIWLEERGVPVRAVPMSPVYVRVIPGTGDELISGYKMGRDTSEQITLAADEVWHGRLSPSPFDPYRGKSRLADVFTEQQIYAAANQYRLTIYDNNARPDAILSVKEGMNQTEREALEHLFNAKHGGTASSGRLAILDGEMTFAPLAFPPKDLGEEQIQDQKVRAILAAFGLPESEVYMNDANRASSRTGNIQYMRQTVLPLAAQDADDLTAWVLEDGYGLEGWCFAPDNVIPEDESEAAAVTQTRVSSGVWTLNEARAAEGLELYPPEIGDVPRINGVSVLALDQQATAPPPAPAFGIPAGFASIAELPHKGPTPPPEPEPEAPGADDPTEPETPQKAAKALSDSDRTPPKGAREEARRGLEWRREHGRGGTEVGVARARDISNGATLSEDTIRRMKAYFDRHESDRQGEGWSPGEDGYPSAGRIAWALWGGDPGRTWASALVDRMEPRKSAPCDCGGHGAETMDSDLWTKAAVEWLSKADIPEVAEDDTPLRDDVPASATLYRNVRAGINARRDSILSAMQGKPFGLRSGWGSSLRTKNALDEAVRRMLAAWGVTGQADAFARTLEQLTRSQVEQLFREGADAGLRSLQTAGAGDFGLEVLENPEAVAQFENHRNAYIQSLASADETMAGEVEAALRTGLEKGETLREIETRIRGVFDGEGAGGERKSAIRAARIARTETAQAQTDGQLGAWKGSRVVKGYKYVMAPNACEFCRAVDRKFAGSVIPLDDPLFRRGDSLRGADGGTLKFNFRDTIVPIHPNCRCAIVPAV